MIEEFINDEYIKNKKDVYVFTTNKARLEGKITGCDSLGIILDRGKRYPKTLIFFYNIVSIVEKDKED